MGLEVAREATCLGEQVALEVEFRRLEHPDRGGLLQAVSVHIKGAMSATSIVTDIDYNARGQRTSETHGNSAVIEREYDPKTFRVRRIHTTRPNPDPDEREVQDLRYHYDPSGNIAEIRDLAQQVIFFQNASVEPTQKFVYDAVYRLIEATGREHDTLTMPTGDGWAELSHPGDATALQNYTQTYTLDKVGNITEVKHAVGGIVAWRRGYEYTPTGNQLVKTSEIGDDPDDPNTWTPDYNHDAHGNMTELPHISTLTWDEDDRLAYTDHGGGGETWYVYDGSGQRVRKVHVNQAETTSKERLYLGPWETYRERTIDPLPVVLEEERETLHVSDGTRRMCLIETKTVTGGSAVGTPVAILRYQYDNHLGTATVELDGSADVISYEEFHPYGTSSYRAADSGIDVSAKRYRYTGQERDEESGLAYHGARYYAPWLGRWTAADPVGLGDGVNRFAYVRGNPIKLHDPAGTSGDDPTRAEVQARATAEAEARNYDLEQARRHIGTELAKAGFGDAP
ncbi:MAG: RHS repeat-associated core domain-containing protein, partial [Nannocystaceae bacterium]